MQHLSLTACSGLLRFDFDKDTKGGPPATFYPTASQTARREMFIWDTFCQRRKAKGMLISEDNRFNHPAKAVMMFMAHRLTFLGHALNYPRALIQVGTYRRNFAMPKFAVLPALSAKRMQIGRAHV